MNVSMESEEVCNLTGSQNCPCKRCSDHTPKSAMFHKHLHLGETVFVLCFKIVFIFDSVSWQVMMMFFPLVLMFLLPKLINTQDPETQRVCIV